MLQRFFSQRLSSFQLLLSYDMHVRNHLDTIETTRINSIIEKRLTIERTKCDGTMTTEKLQLRVPHASMTSRYALMVGYRGAWEQRGKG